MTRWTTGIVRPGVPAALGAGILFGCGTPLAKRLLGDISPWLLAGLLYLGSGIGLTVYRRLTRAPAAKISRNDVGWLIATVLMGGMIAPVLLMTGLQRVAASTASLLLNAEGVCTALLAWFVFRENFDRRIALGMAAIVAGAVVLTWPRSHGVGLDQWPVIAILAACVAWGVDNNLTRKLSLVDPAWLASVKGWSAGAINFSLALTAGAAVPGGWSVGVALLLGSLAYGLSLSLFVTALRDLGTARTSAYFSIAPFVGALVAVGMGEPVTLPLLVCGALMAIGVWLHLTESHEHLHAHEALEHNHEHTHDEHHQHEHVEPVPPGTRHRHVHRHRPLVHSHAHFPDAHHRHEH